MSVYHKDRREQFLKAAASVVTQSCKAAQFVLVQDGPLTPELDDAVGCVQEMCVKAGIVFCTVPLAKNGGLGPALNEGLKYCSEDLVARMDADDISLPDRMKLQLSFMEKHPETALLSGTIVEFEGEDPDVSHIPAGLHRKAVPLTDEAIRKTAAKRNPFNHPCILYRKRAVLEAGGYRSVPLFEDYDLWLRVLFGTEKPDGTGKTAGCKAANLPDELLLMRVDGMYGRRGGLSYSGNIVKFRKQMRKAGYVGLPQNLVITSGRVAVSLLPGGLRKKFYNKFLR